MTIEVSLALLAASAPITAGIIVWRPASSRNGNGKYVSIREYDTFKTDLGDRIGTLERTVGGLNDFVRSRL